VVDALRAGGYDEPALRMITHENWLRVLGATWKT
jgi:membrane dipeptidase